MTEPVGSFATQGTVSEVVLNLSGLISVLQQLAQGQQQLITLLGKVFPLATGTAGTATGGAATLPGNPVGFVSIYVPSLGATVKVPYYSP